MWYCGIPRTCEGRVFFSIWTVLKVNNPLSPPTFSDPLPVSLFVSEMGGNTDLKQLKSSLIRHASFYIKHDHNLIDQQFHRFSGQLHVEAEEGHDGENYCKKNKLGCRVDEEEKTLSNSGNSNIFCKYVPRSRSRHHKCTAPVTFYSNKFQKYAVSSIETKRLQCCYDSAHEN